MATLSGFNPLKGREKDVLLMCEHFLEDDYVKDNPEVYHIKKNILILAVHVLKKLFGDDLEVDHVIRFLTNKEVRVFALELFRVRADSEEQEAISSLVKYFTDQPNVCQNIFNTLAEELSYLPHQ